MLQEILGEKVLPESWVITEPLTLSGAPGASILGASRDALLRVRSRVVIEGITFRRVADADGQPSWGSVIVVEPGGELEMRDCRIEGALHGYLIDGRMPLEDGESRVHAGVEVRGAGMALLRDVAFTRCGIGVLAAVYPSSKRTDLDVEACRFDGVDVAVRVVASSNAVVRRCEATWPTGAPGGVAYQVEGGVLDLHDCMARNPDIGVHARAGLARVEGGVISAPRIGVSGDAQGRIRARRVRVEAVTAAGVAAYGLSEVSLEDTELLLTSGTALHAEGVAHLTARGGRVRTPGAVAVALDAGRLRVDGISMEGEPEWGGYADVAGCIEVIEGTPPFGPLEARGDGRVGTVRGPGIRQEDWLEILGARSQWSDAQRKVAATAWAASGAESSLVAAWVDAGQPGVDAWKAFHGVVAGDAPIRFAPPVCIAQLKGERIRAIFGTEGGCIVAGARGTLVRVGPGGVEARGETHGACCEIFAAKDWVFVFSESASRIASITVHDTALARVGDVSFGSAVAALRVGPPHEVITVDDSGHPTDRCTWRHRWRPPEEGRESEVVGQGEQVPDAAWDWVSPRVPRGGAATVAMGALHIYARDQWLVAEDAQQRCVLRLPLSDVSALGAAPDNTALYVGTRKGEILRLLAL